MNFKKLNMRKFVAGRWFPLALVLLIIGLILTSGFLFGFRITYAPDLNNHWDAISGVAAWVGTIGTVGAIFAAIWVADRQNKIALFEKRYEIYDVVCHCENFAELLKIATTREDIQMLFLLIFCNIPMGEKVNDSFFIRMHYISIIDKMRQSGFLFKDQKIEEYLKNLTGALVRVVGAGLNISEKNMPNDKILQLMNLVNKEQYKMVLEAMEKELTLK